MELCKMYVCMYKCMYTCVYVYMNVCISTYVSVYLYIYVFMYIISGVLIRCSVYLIDADQRMTHNKYRQRRKRKHHK